MALKLGPTGLGFGIDKDRQDFTIYSGGWAIGRIYQQRGLRTCAGLAAAWHLRHLLESVDIEWDRISAGKGAAECLLPARTRPLSALRGGGG